MLEEIEEAEALAEPLEEIPDVVRELLRRNQ